MDFLGAPSNFLVHCFRNFDSKDLGLRDLGIKFHHMRMIRHVRYTMGWASWMQTWNNQNACLSGHSERLTSQDWCISLADRFQTRSGQTAHRKSAAFPNHPSPWQEVWYLRQHVLYVWRHVWHSWQHVRIDKTRQHVCHVHDLCKHNKQFVSRFRLEYII